MRGLYLICPVCQYFVEEEVEALAGVVVLVYILVAAAGLQNSENVEVAKLEMGGPWGHSASVGQTPSGPGAHS